MYQQDWMLRQIEITIQFLARLLFQRDQIDYTVPTDGQLSPADLLHARLLALLADHQICAAEDLLFSQIDTNDVDILKAALHFYQTINEYSDDQLADANFSRDEIQKGLDDIARRYDLPALN